MTAALSLPDPRTVRWLLAVPWAFLLFVEQRLHAQNVLFWGFNPQPGDGVALKAVFYCPVSMVLSTHSVRLDMLVA